MFHKVQKKTYNKVFYCSKACAGLQYKITDYVKWMNECDIIKQRKTCLCFKKIKSRELGMHKDGEWKWSASREKYCFHKLTNDIKMCLFGRRETVTIS